MLYIIDFFIIVYIPAIKVILIIDKKKGIIFNKEKTKKICKKIPECIKDEISNFELSSNSFFAICTNIKTKNKFIFPSIISLMNNNKAKRIKKAKKKSKKGLFFDSFFINECKSIFNASSDIEVYYKYKALCNSIKHYLERNKSIQVPYIGTIRLNLSGTKYTMYQELDEFKINSNVIEFINPNIDILVTDDFLKKTLEEINFNE